MSVRRLAPPEEQPKEFAFDRLNMIWAKEQLEKYPAGRQQSAIISLLWRAQDQSGGWLPEAAIRYVADFLGIPHILEKVCRKRIGDQMHVTADGTFSWVEVECLGACVNAPMIQVGSDFYEDLDADSLNKLLDEFAAGRTPRPGPQIDRQLSEPVGGPTSLTDAAIYAKHGDAAATPKKPAKKEPKDSKAKTPGKSADFREAGTPQPPARDNEKPKPS
jgi:NADH-quinone oxidoreductase subunit E